MLPAGWSLHDTGSGVSGSLNGPQNTPDAEAQMAQLARNKIQARLRMAKLFQQYRAELNTDEHHVTVTSDPASAEEKICLTVSEKKRVVPITVKNCSDEAVYFTFRAADLVKNIFTVRDRHDIIIKTIKKHFLGAGDEYRINVHFFSDQAGFYEQLLVFKFETHPQSSEKFEIMRLLEVMRCTHYSEETPTTDDDSSSDPQSVKWSPTKGVKMMLLRPVLALKKYAIPKDFDPKKCDTDLEMPLSWSNYSQRFRLLLHLEEHQLRAELEKFAQKNVQMFKHDRCKKLFTLKITHNLKNVPAKLPGNQAVVTPLDQSGSPEKKTYKGWVQHVDLHHVYMELCDTFLSRFKEGMRVDLKFAIDRLPMRHQHRAVTMVYKQRLREVLFPTGQLSSHHSHSQRLLDIRSNPEQHMAIQHILARSAKPAPYLVFGPPGTGKTVTLVEAIKQIVKTQSSCNILACAPSNSAADVLCEKILDSGMYQAYRLYALNFSVTNIPPKLKFNCNLNPDENTFIIPPKRALMRYKIMVTTLLTAGRLVGGGIPPGHYTYIFVDEAGQATESECIIPIAGLLKPQRCQVVLAGDPKQLGPIITSQKAEGHGMGVSLLERLMSDVRLYQSHENCGFNNRFVTKLLRNYRSHPAILKIPNELFYESQLQPYACREQCGTYCRWEELPKKGFPLIFHGVAGTDERDANSPSVYNMAEVEVLKGYLKTLVSHLLKKDGDSIGPGEIGIIAPYRKQVQKIQNALWTDKDLKKENLENILVGSVEKFQGKEFNVILLSTVRSNPKLTVHGQRITVGFLDNEKRFNVAMTRAQALLIVIGDPRVLKTDETWNKFIHYCSKEGGYRGIRVSDEEDILTHEESQSVRGE